MIRPGMRLARAARKPAEKGLADDTVRGRYGGRGWRANPFHLGDSRQCGETCRVSHGEARRNTKGAEGERTLVATTQPWVFFNHGFERMTRISRMEESMVSVVLGLMVGGIVYQGSIAMCTSANIRET